MRVKDLVAAMFIASIFALGFSGCWLLYRDQEECDARGGVMVKQPLGYKCLVIEK